MDTISFGSSREPKRRRIGWRPPRLSPRRHGWWLVALAAAAAVVATAVLVTTGGPARRAASAPTPSAPPSLLLLRGLPAQAVRTDLFLAGENFWQDDGRPRPVAAEFLRNGLSPILPPGHGAQADQLVPVPGGVVAHISDMSTGITSGAIGWVIFIPAGTAPAQVI